MNRVPSNIDRLAESWYDYLVSVSPSLATAVGSTSGADKLDDYSPAAAAEYHAKLTAFLAKLNQAEPTDFTDEITKHAMTTQLGLEVEMHDAKLPERNLNVIASPAQGIRDVFDVSPVETEADWRNRRAHERGRHRAGRIR
jgi:uncharacterized protein (DUF885 family)